MTTGRVLVLAALLLALASCGESDRGISEQASDRLLLRVEAIRTAALAGDPASLALEIDGFRAHLDELRARDEISDERASAALRALMRVEAAAGAVPTTTTTTTTTTLPRVDDGDDDEDRGDEDHRNGDEDRGNGKDNGKGDGGDD